MLSDLPRQARGESATYPVLDPVHPRCRDLRHQRAELRIIRPEPGRLGDDLQAEGQQYAFGHTIDRDPAQDHHQQPQRDGDRR